MAVGIDRWYDTLHSGKLIPEKEVRMLGELVKDILIEENNVQFVNAPVTIGGNINGQFFDLLKLFEAGGELPETQYIFLGDYVNRGCQSTETILFLFILKIKYPSLITILRGNHESESMTKVYGFYDESLK